MSRLDEAKSALIRAEAAVKTLREEVSRLANADRRANLIEAMRNTRWLLDIENVAIIEDEDAGGEISNYLTFIPADFCLGASLPLDEKHVLFVEYDIEEEQYYLIVSPHEGDDFPLRLWRLAEARYGVVIDYLTRQEEVVANSLTQSDDWVIRRSRDRLEKVKAALGGAV